MTDFEEELICVLKDIGKKIQSVSFAIDSNISNSIDDLHETLKKCLIKDIEEE